MTSESESSSRPSVDADWRQRATRPSSASNTNASGISAMPHSRSRTTPSCRKRIAAKIAPVPQNALASVNQSASWKSRSIEKWRFCIGSLPAASGRPVHPAKAGVRRASTRTPPRAAARLAASLPRDPVMTPRCILVTGAGSGIGAGIATELAIAGHHLVVTDVAPAAARSVSEAIRAAGGSAEALALDVTSDDSIAAALAQASRPVDVLLNNAGLQHVAPLEDFPMDKWNFLVEVMLVGVARLTRAVLPGMRARGFGR